MSEPETKRLRTQDAIFTEIAFEANSACGWLARYELDNNQGEPKPEYIAWMKLRIRTLLNEQAADA